MLLFTGLLLLNLLTAISPLSPPPSTILLTGGSGYIGSHTAVSLLRQGHDCVIYDDLSNSNPVVHDIISSLAASPTSKPGRLHFRQGSITDKARLLQTLTEFPSITSCIHFAGKKAVGESSALPLPYYDVNVCGTVNLLTCLQAKKISNFVFSSSATVYGNPATNPITESMPLTTTNPYGRTKLFVEEILRDVHASNPTFWNVMILRYFNPIGAHESGRMGEDPNGIPNNLMPFMAQVAGGRRAELSIFGGDYDTPDGTGVRDYIHVVDLAEGHCAALRTITNQGGGCDEINLGTGRGYSVLEVVEGMRKASGKEIKYTVGDRRPGDVAECYASPAKAEKILKWRATKTLEDMCEDTWRWQEMNPNGYAEEAVQEVS